MRAALKQRLGGTVYFHRNIFDYDEHGHAIPVWSVFVVGEKRYCFYLHDDGVARMSFPVGPHDRSGVLMDMEDILRLAASASLDESLPWPVKGRDTE